ncbi:MAG: hypothetical protein WEE89_22965 [Gemmatimonadota bacterium]
MVALAVISLIPHGRRAVLIATLISTIILEGWAWVDLEEFDPVFLLIIIALALLPALAVNALAARRKSRIKQS